MITFACDRCERMLEVDDELAGQKVECPHCGDVNRVPSTPTAAAAKPEAPRAEDEPERTILRVRPAEFRGHPLLSGVAFLLAAGGLGGAGYFLIQQPMWAAVLCGIGALVGLVMIARFLIRRVSASLTITNKRTVQTRGLFSKATSEVAHDNIRNFQVDQSLWCRIWRVGQVGISSAGQDDVEIVVKNIPSPYKLRDVIDKHREF